MISIVKNIFKKVKKRKTQVYCLGAAKTGTTTIAGIYQNELVSAHEPLAQETTRFVIDFLKGSVSETECKKYLLNRDNSLRLDLESSHPLGYFSQFLNELFPNAKYIITIREPYNWLKSRLDFHYSVNPAEWEPYRKYIWGRNHKKYNIAEKILEKNKLYSLDAYLKQYSEQYETIFNSLPPEKTFIVKTSEISNQINEISYFLNVSSNVKALHLNKKKNYDNIIDRIDREFVDDKISIHCQWLIEKYFS